MKPSDWFGVGVRLLGLYMLINSVPNILGAFWGDKEFVSDGVSNFHVIHGLWYFITGIILLRGAKMIIGFSYSDEAKPNYEP